MTLVFLFTLAIGQMWGTDVEFVAGTGTGQFSQTTTLNSHAVVKLITNATGGNAQSRQIWKDGSTNKNETAIQFSSSAGNDPSTKYIEISVASGYKITGVTVRGANGGSTSATTYKAYCFAGAYSTETGAVTSLATLAFPGYGGSSDGANVSMTGIANGTRTIRIYKQVKYNSSTKTIGNVSGASSTPSSVANANISKITVTYEVACTAPTTAFAEGAYIVGGSALALSSLISNNNSDGAISYTVKTDGGTSASISEGSFSATAAGTATITATQAADATNGKCEKIIDFNVVVSAAPSANPVITGAVNEDGWGSVDPASITVTSGNTVSIVNNVLTCGGQTLTATATTATTEYTYAFVNWTGVANGDAVTANVTATANFSRTPVNYTLAWDKNAEDADALAGDYTNGTVAFGTTIVKPNNPTRDGYDFLGWAESTDGDVVTVPETMPAADKTYYAKWAADPCAEPAKVTNEIARFFVPCGLSNSKGDGTVWAVSGVASSTGDNTFSTYKFGGSVSSKNWYRNTTSGLIYGKLTGNDGYIQIKLNNDKSFAAGDVVYVYCNRDNTSKSSVKLHNQSSGNEVTLSSTAANVEASGSYTLVAADIEEDGSLKFFRSNSNTYVNRIIVTRCAAPAISAQPEDASLAVGDANPTLSFTATGATSYAWKESSDGTSYDGESALVTTANYTPEVNDAVQTKYYYCELTNACGTIKTDIVTVNVAASITYYTVTLVPAGGTIDDATDWTLNEDNYTKTVAEGTELTLPTFTKENRTFKTWRKAGPTDVTSPITVTADITLTAVWNATVEQVIYSWEGAQGGATEVGGTVEGSTTNLINQAQAGYYCLRIDGKADWSTNYLTLTLSGEEKVKTGDKIKFTAFYNKYDGETAKTANASFKMSTAKSGGDIFDMGTTDLLPHIYNGTGTPANYTKTVPDGINAGIVYLTRSQTGSTSWVSKLQIIRPTLVEEANLRTVTFNYNDGGATESTTVEVASGSKVAAPAAPSYAHHRFHEWQLGGVVYDFSTAVTSNITLTADWTQLYTISFAAGDGSGDAPAAIADKAEGETFPVPANTFTAPEGKEFNKWNDGSADYAPGDTYTVGTANVVLTALWKAPAAHYAITYNKGAYGTGTIEAGDKTEDVTFTLSAERFTRDGYVQTGWATEDGGAKAYDLGGSYTANAAIELFPVWTALDTYTAAFGCNASAPVGWTFSNNGWGAENATAAYVCTFVDNSITTPKQAGKTTDDMVAFAKNTAAVATFDLGITTIVAGLDATLIGGSGDSFNEKIEFVGEDGTTVKKSYTNSLSAGNWLANDISKTDIVENVRYIKVYGANKWVVMSAFSIKYVETRTKYDVEFAAGGGTGDPMTTLKYIAGAEVALPACTFTAPEGKEFDAWTSSDVTISDGKFTMPASDVTVTATWKTQIIRYDVTFETNGGSTIDAQEVEANGNPTAVANPTKTNYVFMGWFNNSDLAPEHAVADITALTITEDITLYAKWQLDVKLQQVVFSNGFDAFIKNSTVEAYYMEGTSAPTMVSYQGANLKAENAVAIVGNKVQVTGSDESVVEYDLTLEAVAPMTSYDLQTFDGTETYVKTGNAFSTASDKYGWKFSKNDDNWQRETPGQNRIYFFVGGSADKVTFTSGAPNRAIKVYVNNELVSSVTATAASGSTFDIPLPAANANNMIAIVSDQTSGDGSVKDMKLNEHVISTDVSLALLTVNGNDVDLTTGTLEGNVMTFDYVLPYGTTAAPTVVAVANAAPYATVSDITVDGVNNATFTVTAEDATAQEYAVQFSVARFPTIVIWDGSTMGAVKESPDASGLAWEKTSSIGVSSFSAKTCEENGKSYTKALDFGGKTTTTRQFSITVPDGYVAKVSLVYRAKGTGRSIMISSALSDVVNDKTISSVEAVDNENLYTFTSLFNGGTLYINTTDGFHVHEISVQLAPGYSRSAMLGNGVLGTVCVPNNVAIEDIQGVTVYELMGRDYTNYGKLAFDEIVSGELEAGVPYLFQANGDHMSMLYGETHVNNPVNKGNGMYGTFEQTVLSGDQLDGVYYFAQKALWSCEGALDLTIGANRAYVKLGEIPELNANQMNPAPGRRRVTMAVNGEKVATGMENVQGDDVQSTKMLINGQLFILRGEKMYDATGRLVK